MTFGNRRDRFMCGFADTRGGYTDFSAGGGFIHNRLSSDKGNPFARQLLCAGENSDRLKYLVSELETYYESVKWRKDFENDEAGLLPKNLKRGVLSEDGIYNLLEEYREVSE